MSEQMDSLRARVFASRTLRELRAVLDPATISELGPHAVAGVMGWLLEVISRAAATDRGGVEGLYLLCSKPLGVAGLIHERTRRLVGESRDEVDAAFEANKQRYLGWLESPNPGARSAGAIALGWIDDIDDNDLARLRAASVVEADVTARAAMLLVLGLQQRDAWQSDDSDLFLVPDESPLLLRVSAAGALGLSGNATPRLASQLVDACSATEKLPIEWGEDESNGAGLSELAIALLTGGRFPAQSEAPVALLKKHKTSAAANAALNLSLGPDAWSNSCGPSWCNMRGTQRTVFTLGTNTYGTGFDLFGVYHLNVRQFVEEKEFPWTTVALGERQSEWRGNVPALLRGVIIGAIDLDVAVSAVGVGALSDRVVAALLRGPEWLKVVLNLYGSGQWISPILEFLEALIRERHAEGGDSFLEAEVDSLGSRFLPETVLVVIGHLFAVGKPPAVGVSGLASALRSDRCETLARAVRALPVAFREALIVASRSWNYADVCLTDRIVAWMLARVTDDDADRAIEILTKGNFETAQALSSVTPREGPAQAVVALSLELLRETGAIPR